MRLSDFLFLWICLASILSTMAKSQGSNKKDTRSRRKHYEDQDFLAPSESVQHADRPPSSHLNISYEKALLRELVENYREIGVAGRPVRNISTPVIVYFGMGLVTMDIVEKDNLLTLAVWLINKWTDEYLQWEPADYGGITEVRLPSSMIWMPDIMLYNTASTERYEREAMVVVTYDGNVTWFPHRIFHSACAVDVKNFPFDNQTCHLWFGSWTHPLAEIDMRLIYKDGIDLSTFQEDFKETVKWDIVTVKAERLIPAKNGKPFAVAALTLHLQRRMTFSSYILTLPVVFMSFLTLLVFWLPAETTDKSNVGLAIFGSLLLLLLILLEAAPPTVTAVPMLGLYYCFNIVIVMLSIFLSSIVSKLVADTNNSRMNNRVPHCLRKIFLMAPILCMGKAQDFDELRREASTERIRKWQREQERLLNNLEHNCYMKTLMNNGGARAQFETWQATITGLCRTLTDYINMKSREESLRKEKQAILEEWRHLAAILDRIFLLAYLIVILTSLAFLFPK